MDDRRRWPAVIAAVVAVAALGFTVFSAYPLLRYSSYTVSGASMAPPIPADGRVRAESFDVETRAGEIVLLRLPRGERGLVLKRIVAVGRARRQPADAGRIGLRGAGAAS